MPGGYVYRLFCGDLSYYGSSRRSDRLACHKYNYNTYKRNGDKDVSSVILFEIAEEKGLEVKCEILEQFDDIITEDLRKREDHYICNFDCVNEKRAFLSEEDKKIYRRKNDKNYRKKNKLRIAEKRNREKGWKIEYNKQYRIKNKENIKLYNANYREKKKLEKVSTQPLTSS
jgi:hypothetical protein